MCLCPEPRLNTLSCGASDCQGYTAHTVETNTATTLDNTTCPKCYKPYYYIGDPIGDISNLICACGTGPGMFLPKNKYDMPSFGWECPRCHKINSPFMQQCSCPSPTFTMQTSNWGASGFPPACEHDFGEGECCYEECKFYCGNPERAKEKRAYFSALAKAIVDLI